LHHDDPRGACPRPDKAEGDVTDQSFALGADDDLPRTFRREREAQARQRAAAKPDTLPEPQAFGIPDSAHMSDFVTAPQPSVVRAIDMPFSALVAFFLKAALAAIPALLMLTVILWLAGTALQTMFPQLVKMKILIHFPG
jgi:hypothetical protein